MPDTVNQKECPLKINSLIYCVIHQLQDYTLNILLGSAKIKNMCINKRMNVLSYIWLVVTNLYAGFPSTKCLKLS